MYLSAALVGGLRQPAPTTPAPRRGSARSTPSGRGTSRTSFTRLGEAPLWACAASDKESQVGDNGGSTITSIMSGEELYETFGKYYSNSSWYSRKRPLMLTCSLSQILPGIHFLSFHTALHRPVLRGSEATKKPKGPRQGHPGVWWRTSWHRILTALSARPRSPRVEGENLRRQRTPSLPSPSMSGPGRRQTSTTWQRSSFKKDDTIRTY